LLIQRETVTCPYCWQSIEITVDLSAVDQTYGKDCSVCCRPMVISFQTDGEALAAIEVSAESEA
jgi:cysteine-rich CPXCG protein